MTCYNYRKSKVLECGAIDVDELVIEFESVFQFQNSSGGPIDMMDAMRHERDMENLTIVRRSDM